VTTRRACTQHGGQHANDGLRANSEAVQSLTSVGASLRCLRTSRSSEHTAAPVGEGAARQLVWCPEACGVLLRPVPGVVLPDCKRRGAHGYGGQSGLGCQAVLHSANITTRAARTLRQRGVRNESGVPANQRRVVALK
jgi:hypothetical protein